MSTFLPMMVACPSCGHREERVVAQSIHGPRLPQAVTDILEGRFQRVKCSACEAIFELDAPLVLMDFERKIWIAMYPKIWESRWEELEKETLESFSRNTVRDAPRIVKEMVEGFRVRTVFGLSALQEKLLCFFHGIPDDALEVLKLQLLRDIPGAGFSATHKPRLVQLKEDTLHFELVTQGQFTGLAISREKLDALILDPLSWTQAHSAVTGPAYVDLGRMGRG